MFLCSCVLAGLLALHHPDSAAPAVEKAVLPDGVYAVQREGLKEKDVQPLGKDEVLAVDRDRFSRGDTKEPPRFLVVHPAPDVRLDLAEEPRADRENGEVVRIFLKLKPEQAKALEKLTRERRGRQVAIVLAGEVVTVHKVREAITGGEVQITSCTPRAAPYLLEKLQAHYKKK